MLSVKLLCLARTFFFFKYEKNFLWRELAGSRFFFFFFFFYCWLRGILALTAGDSMSLGGTNLPRVIILAEALLFRRERVIPKCFLDGCFTLWIPGSLVSFSLDEFPGINFSGTSGSLPLVSAVRLVLLVPLVLLPRLPVPLGSPVWIPLIPLLPCPQFSRSDGFLGLGSSDSTASLPSVSRSDGFLGPGFSGSTGSLPSVSRSAGFLGLDSSGSLPSVSRSDGFLGRLHLRPVASAHHGRVQRHGTHLHCRPTNRLSISARPADRNCPPWTGKHHRTYGLDSQIPHPIPSRARGNYSVNRRKLCMP